jgi:proprotein convertase subtilisin/kexin type 5
MICASGYQLNYFSSYSDSIQCILCNVNNCNLCHDTNICQNCIPGYYLMNGSCLQCNYPCQMCYNNGTCQSCQTPYFAGSPTSNGSCIIQTVPNCYQYSTNSSITTCINCQYNYALNTTSNTCYYVCSANCMSCDSY